MAAKILQDFEMRQGDHRFLDFTIDDGANPPVAVDITAFTGEWMMAPSRESTSPTITKAMTIVNGPLGIARITLIPSDTINLRGEFYHELEMENPAAQPSVVAEGIVTIKAAQTR